MKKKFTGTIREGARGGAYVVVPIDIEKVFGKQRLKVKATIDGVPYQGSIVRKGGPDHILGILKSIRAQLDKDIGDEVAVVFEEDTKERTVEVPPDLAKALAASPAANKFFDSLSYTHQREYVTWVLDARREETRGRRVVKTVEMLESGKRGR